LFFFLNSNIQYFIILINFFIWNAKVSEGELHLEKLEHRLSKAKDDAKDSEKRVDAMLEKHVWINEDRHHFGVAGSN
jgi:hypothetical protein